VRGKNLLLISLVALLLSSVVMVDRVAAASARMYVDPKEIRDIPAKDPPITFNLAIKVDVTNLYAWEFTLSFIPSLLNVTGVTRGLFLGTAGKTAWELGWFEPGIDNDNGLVTVGDMLMPDEWTGQYPLKGATGTGGVLATIQFQVIGSGICILDLHSTELSTLIGGQFSPILHTVEDGLFDNRPTKLPPNAIFTYSHPGMTMPVAGLPITFDASESNDADDGGWIVSYNWNFGDGTTGSGKVIEHTFAMVGTYTVCLTVFDNDGKNDTATEDITVVDWMAGGTFPDILDAKPESQKWNEPTRGTELRLFGLVGNPTQNDFQVYVEFTIFDTEQAKKLGTINTATVTIGSNKTLELSAIMDLSDPRWRVGPDKVSWGDGMNLVWAKYTAFAKCYHSVIGGFEKGFITKDFGFKVHPTKHDIAVLQVTTNATNGNIMKGDLLAIYVTMENQAGGQFTETFTITVAYKGLTTPMKVLETRPSELAPYQIKTETFILNTGTLKAERHLITATLSTLTYELDTLDNSGDSLISVRWAHDVRVASVTPLNEAVEPGETALINVEVANEGINPETFTVTAYYGSNVIGTQTVTNLASTLSKTLTFEWNTAGIAKGAYTIKAEASLATDLYLSNNILVDGTIKVTKRPVASFTILPSPTCLVNDPLTFNATASFDPDGTIVSYKWDFGDGNVITVASPIITHKYTSIRSFTVTLTVTDDIGVTSSTTKDATVLGHDIKVTSVIAEKIGKKVSIEVTVINAGSFTETFTVTVYANTTVIGTQAVTNLVPGGTVTLTFEWDLTGVAKGVYTIKAEAPLATDAFPKDNILVDGTIKIGPL